MDNKEIKIAIDARLGEKYRAIRGGANEEL